MVISALQADLDSLLEPKVGQDEMDQGRLLQLRAKQEAHHQSEIDAVNQELSAVQSQIEVLNSKAAQLNEVAEQTAIKHQGDMATIDQAIAKVVPVQGAKANAAPIVSQATTAQVLSATLGTAVNDPTFLSSLSPEHQAAIKSFCAQVTAHFATDHPIPSSSASDVSMTEASMSGGAAEVSLGNDLNPHNFVGHLA